MSSLSSTYILVYADNKGSKETAQLCLYTGHPSGYMFHCFYEINQLVSHVLHSLLRQLAFDKHVFQKLELNAIKLCVSAFTWNFITVHSIQSKCINNSVIPHSLLTT